MAKVKQDNTEAAESKAAKPKKAGRNDLVNETTLNGESTFAFSDPMTETGPFTSYNGGKGTHAFCVVRSDGKLFKSGRTGLKYLKHADGKTLFDHVASQSKRGRPKSKKDNTEGETSGVEAPVGDESKKEGTDAFDFMDKKKPA